MKKTITIFSLLAISAGCGPQSEDSSLNQAWDKNSDVTLSGYTNALDSAELKDSFSVRTERLPWTDTYWPSVNKGLSYRWGRLTANPSSEIGLVDFLDTHLAEAGKEKPSVYLSPAEKYDLMYRWRYSKELTSETLAALRTELAAKESEIAATQDLPQKRTAVGQMNSALLANSGVLQSVLPLSRDGWTTWTNRTSSSSYQYLDQAGTGDGWAWEGLCHGWAPAALFAETPQHAVKVKMDEKELLLTEGDIRGLLTYAWANHSPYMDEYFIGRRCNLEVGDESSRGPLDKNGRNIYGTIQKKDSDAAINFALIKEMTPSWLDSSWIYGVYGGTARPRLYSIRLEDGSGKTSFLLTLNYVDLQGRARGTVNYFSDNLATLKNYLSDRRAAQPMVLKSVDINGCGDVNPAALHTTMIKTLKEEKIGFVIDRTQSGQVWNQPVYAADVNVQPTEKLAKVIKDYPGLAKRVSPGTDSIAQVSVNLKWSYEPNSPSFDYTREYDERYATGPSNLQYILEFDEAGKLIGGEWGTFVETQPSSQVPDFIFGYKKGSKPLDSLAAGFDYSGIIGKIHACSLKDTADGSEMVRGSRLSYVNCDISKAAP